MQNQGISLGCYFAIEVQQCAAQYFGALLHLYQRLGGSLLQIRSLILALAMLHLHIYLFVQNTFYIKAKFTLLDCARYRNYAGAQRLSASMENSLRGG